MLINAEVGDKSLKVLRDILSTSVYVLFFKKSIMKYLKGNMQYLNWEMSFLWNHDDVVRKRWPIEVV